MSEEIDLEAIEKAQAEAEENKLKLSPALQRFIDPYQLKKDVSFSEYNLDDAMAQQASLYAYYASMATKAQLQCDRMKHQVEIVEAKLYHEYRNEHKGEKVTESFISKMVMIDGRHAAATKRYNEARMISSLAKEATEALKQRRDMLTQASKWQLEQQKGELFLKGKDSSIESKKQSVLDKMRK